MEMMRTVRKGMLYLTGSNKGEIGCVPWKYFLRLYRAFGMSVVIIMKHPKIDFPWETEWALKPDAVCSAYLIGLLLGLNKWICVNSLKQYLAHDGCSINKNKTLPTVTLSVMLMWVCGWRENGVKSIMNLSLGLNKTRKEIWLGKGPQVGDLGRSRSHLALIRVQSHPFPSCGSGKYGPLSPSGI